MIILKNGKIKKSLLETHPELAKEWHSTKNGKVTPFDVTYQLSYKKVWWRCSKDHEWKTSLRNRTRRKTGCPYCCNQKVNISNCLYTMHPELSKEWHPTKNGKVTPFDVTYGSHKNVWWKCSKGHEWKTSVALRKNQQTRCPYCTNRKIDISNCLSTVYPELAKEWHPTKNGKVTPFDVIHGSGKHAWWKCSKGHEWRTKIFYRGKTGCPYCTNRKIDISNCLYTTHPELAKEWHPTKNGKVTPFDVTYGSGKHAWWKCSKGHEWKVSPNGRAKDNGCTICNCRESKGEKIIQKLLLNKNIIFTRQKKFDSCRKKRKLPFDFYIEYNNNIFLIEYNGEQHYYPVPFNGHKKYKQNFIETKESDKIKKRWCKKNGIPFLVIPYTNFKKIEELVLNFIGFK